MQSNETSFSRRYYPYIRETEPQAMEADERALALEGAQEELEPGKIYRFVTGIDTGQMVMAEEEIERLLNDSFAGLLLKKGVFPHTPRELISALDAHNHEPGGLPEQKSFVIADGGQIPWTAETADLPREFRIAVTRARSGETLLMISCSRFLDAANGFLQVLAWDDANKVYNYYQRLGTIWSWAGNSHHALAPETRGQTRSPFDSHVNGSLVMKELNFPWQNWHSMSASIQDTAFAPGEAFTKEKIFIERASANEMENVVRGGIRRWNNARLNHCVSEDKQTLKDVPYFFRQILETTTVNLITSSQQSNQINDQTALSLPISFFINKDVLLEEDSSGLAPDISPIRVSGKFYREALAKYDFHLGDRQGNYVIKGDTFFAFLVPEPAFEDSDVLLLLLEKKIISRRFAACLMMIDFQNPINSPRRAFLMKYVPQIARLASGASPESDIETQFVAAVEADEANFDAAHPAKEFLANWRLPKNGWQTVFEKRIEDYFRHLTEKSNTASGFDAWMQLAESRRREFQRHPLKEFDLTTPLTNIPENAPLLEMNPDATVREKNLTSLFENPIN